jgi:glycosyltransferase involved in cell wall biosynthesis
MNNSEKIGVCITTCNRENLLHILLNSLSKATDINELVIINDGDKLQKSVSADLVQNERNLGIAKSKNKGLRFLREKNCDYIFLIEDDVEVIDLAVFSTYIQAYKLSNIHHFNFAFHGLDNYKHDGSPAVRLSVEYSPTVKVDLFPNVYGAFSFYTKHVLDTVGYMDENYYNAMEHVDHTLEIIKARLHPPFRWFADISNSNKYLKETDPAHANSEIRKSANWVTNFHKAADRFANKHGFDVRSSIQPMSNKNEVIQFLKSIKQ